MFRVLAAALLGALLSSPVVGRTYDSCIAHQIKLNAQYLTLLELMDELQTMSRRAYPAGAGDTDPGLLLFQHMRDQPAKIRNDWRETQQRLSAYCDHVWEK
jgi:hypothetical protein